MRSIEPSELSSSVASMLRSASREGEWVMLIDVAELVLLLLPRVIDGPAVEARTCGGLCIPTEDAADEEEEEEEEETISMCADEEDEEDEEYEEEGDVEREGETEECTTESVEGTFVATVVLE